MGVTAIRTTTEGSSRLGELLVRRSVITVDQFEGARTYHEAHGVGLAASLVRLGHLTSADLAALLHREYRLPLVDPTMTEPAPQAVALLGAAVARRHRVVPISLEGKLLTIAMADPSNLAALNEIKFSTGCTVKVALASVESIEKALDKIYGKTSSYSEVLSQLGSDLEVVKDADEVDLKELQRSTEDAPVVKLVNALLGDAIERQASDIHIEPYQDDIRVRFRIDGVLQDVMEPPVRLKRALVSRIKILASLDIAERRLPQDGRIKLRTAGRNEEVSFRVSTLPTLFGEKAVLRLLGKTRNELDMEGLGFEPEALAVYRRAIRQPWGMVLVTGPTGSGKTTTLYAALAEINDATRNISSVEDPVEIHLRGINQVPVNEAVGLTFAGALRAFLRQDPDVLMVGEIRDGETAEIAVKAALTGHLVLSTLHTNDAPTTVTRLINMGVEPFLVASSVNLVIAQRLIRLICPACKVAADDSAIESLRLLGVPAKEARDLEVFRGAGCDRCGHTGYRGRRAIYEVLSVTDELRELIMTRGSTLEIRQKAEQSGMVSLKAAGLANVRAGLTTVDELLRVAAAE